MDIKGMVNQLLESDFDGNLNLMSKTIGIPQSSLWNLINKDGSLSYKSVKKLFNYLGGGFTIDQSRYEFIKRVKPELFRNMLEKVQGVEGQIVFKREWLTSLNISALNNLSALEVFSEDINLLSPGDMILIDEGDKGEILVEDKIYIIKKGENLYIRRYKEDENCLIFEADNGENIEVDKVKWGDFMVIGKALWVGKEL